MNRWIANGATGLIVLCAVAVAAATVRREVQYRRDSSVTASVRIEKDWASYATGGHVLGSADGVTIVEFSDFQCPFCTRFAEYVDSLRILGENVRVIYRHLPGARHELAIPAIALVNAQQMRVSSNPCIPRCSLIVIPWVWRPGGGSRKRPVLRIQCASLNA